MSVGAPFFVDVPVALEKVTAFQACAQLQYRTTSPVTFKNLGAYCVVFRAAGIRENGIPEEKEDKENEEKDGTVVKNNKERVSGSDGDSSTSLQVPAPHDRIWSEMDPDSLQVRLLHNPLTLPSVSARLLLRDVRQHTRVIEDPVNTEVQEIKAALREVTSKLKGLQREVEIRQGSIRYLSQLKQSMVSAMEAHQPCTAADPTAAAESSISPVERFRLNPENWMQMAKFVASKTRAYQEELIDLREEIERLEKKKANINTSLASLRESSDTHVFYRSRVETVVEATVDWLPSSILQEDLPSSLSVGLQLSFMVPGVHWEPVYDIRVHRSSRTMEVGYFANISQNTGVAWEEVVLCLSTASPQVSSSPPLDDQPWTISLQPPRPPVPVCRSLNLCAMGVSRRKAAPRNGVMANGANAMEMDEVDVQEVDMAPMVEAEEAPPVSHEPPKAMKRIFRSSAIGGGQDSHGSNGSSNSGRATTFTIPGRVTIASEKDHPVRVCITVVKLPVTLKFTCTPKLDPLVYLHAHGVNTTPFEWLPGPANVYYNQTFVCRTSLPYTTGGGGGKIKIALGADEDSVKVKRKQVKQSTAEGHREALFSFTTHTVVRYAYQLEVTPEVSGTEIHIIDQYPISTHEEMKVRLKEPSITGTKMSSSSSKQRHGTPLRLHSEEFNDGSGKEEEESSFTASLVNQEVEREEKEEHKTPFFIRPGVAGTVNQNDHTVTWILQDPPLHETQRFPLEFSVQYPEKKFLPVGLES